MAVRLLAYGKTRLIVSPLTIKGPVPLKKEVLDRVKAAAPEVRPKKANVSILPFDIVPGV